MRKFFLFFVGVGLISHGWIIAGAAVVYCSVTMEGQC